MSSANHDYSNDNENKLHLWQNLNESWQNLNEYD